MMNGTRLAEEMLAAIGGKRTKDRQRAFARLAQAIVRHIQTNMVVTSVGADPQGGTVTSTSTLVQ